MNKKDEYKRKDEALPWLPCDCPEHPSASNYSAWGG